MAAWAGARSATAETGPTVAKDSIRFGTQGESFSQGAYEKYGWKPWIEFRARVRHALEAVRANARGQRIAVFTSAGPVAAAVQMATGTDDETALALAFRVRNSSVSEFLFDGQRFSLATFNETPHLQDAAMVTVR